MPTFTLVEDNVVAAGFADPRTAWTLNAPPYYPTLRAIERFTEWAEANSLDIRTIPAESGSLVIRLESPDGGLLADVTEFDLTRPRLDRDTGTLHRVTRTVPVDSIPPVLGVIPEWAARFVTTTEETR